MRQIRLWLWGKLMRLAAIVYPNRRGDTFELPITLSWDEGACGYSITSVTVGDTEFVPKEDWW